MTSGAGCIGFTKEGSFIVRPVNLMKSGLSRCSSVYFESFRSASIAFPSAETKYLEFACDVGEHGVLQIGYRVVRVWGEC